MLGRRDPQASIFDGDQVYLDHVGRSTFYGYLASERHKLFRDEDFAGLYHERWGRPSVPPSSLCVALVLQAYEGGCSDREASDRAAYDQRWKVALGCGEMERPFVRSTLQLFRAQLLIHDQEKALFEASLEAARRSGRLRREGQIRVALDTTGMSGAEAGLPSGIRVQPAELRSYPADLVDDIMEYSRPSLEKVLNMSQKRLETLFPGHSYETIMKALNLRYAYLWDLEFGD